LARPSDGRAMEWALRASRLEGNAPKLMYNLVYTDTIVGKLYRFVTEGVLLFKVSFHVLLLLWVKCQSDCNLYFSGLVTMTVDAL